MRNPFRRKDAQKPQEPSWNRQPGRYEMRRAQRVLARLAANQEPLCRGAKVTVQIDREAGS
jgi:hypothetical protein